MNWDEFFYEMLLTIRKKSKDPSTQVACVIVGDDNEVRSLGFNGFPRGVEDDPEKVPERYERPEKYVWFEHGERNAIYNAARMGTPLNGCRLYVTGYPCTDCARAIIKVGIKEVIIGDLDSPGFLERWKDQIERSTTMFEESGIKVRLYKNGKENEQI